MRFLPIAAAACALLALPSPAFAQGAPTVPVAPLAPEPASPAPSDTPYPGGAMRLVVDASDVTRGLYRITQTIPVAPGTGRITLLYPQWLPGNHAPRGPIAELADLRISAGGKPLTWTRDPFEVHAFTVELPAGTRELTARFVHTSPLRSAEGRVTMTREMLNLQWEKVSLYPAGHYVRQIRVRPEVVLPQGWTPGTALRGMSRSGDRVNWAETDYETLVDSPIFAGIHFRQWDIGNDARLDVVADEADLLGLRAEHAAHASALMDEALLTFGAPPFDRYHFLVALSDRLGGIGLEHLESSENALEPRSFVDWDKLDWDRNVLAHELAHAWNGKYRRPARLWTPDYRQPMLDDLLWVYEGQTQFWGWVLAARSGLQDKATVLGLIARSAGYLTEQPGRAWRSVGDTTNDPVLAGRKAKPYASLARGEDYYNEGALIWLEADQLIREGTGGRRGLDDFARAFFAHDGGEARVKLYTFDDVVAALNRVHPHDWAQFLRSRIDDTGRPAPLAGIEKAGYRLVWKDQPNPFDKAQMETAHEMNLYYSLGFAVDSEGLVKSVQWESPAFTAGIVTGAKIVAVDAYAFTPDRLVQAVTRAGGERKPIALLVRRGDRFETVSVPYYKGLRWPWIEPVQPGRAGGLDRLLAPRRKGASQ